MLLKMIKVFLCKTFKIGIRDCLKNRDDFNLVIRDTSTSIQRSMLECKKCNRTIGF
jgi:hypothetical protein